MRYVKVLFPTLLIIITFIALTSCGTFTDYREDEYKEFKEKKIPLMIKTNEIESVNSVGGVEVSISHKNSVLPIDYGGMGFVSSLFGASSPRRDAKLNS